MLNSTQRDTVRAQIAQLLKIEANTIEPSSRFFGDLGATHEHLKPLRLAIENSLSLQIEPIVNEVNLRTAVGSNGLLTKSSMTQIVDYLGDWPDQPQQEVTFVDLFTVGMIEAMVAKAAEGPPPTIEHEPLQLSPEATQIVHRQVAKYFKITKEQIHSELELPPLRKDGVIWFIRVLNESKHALNIDCSPEVERLNQWLEDRAAGVATPFAMQNLRRFVPNIDSLVDDDGQDHTATVGLIERLCAAAIARRKSPTGRPRREALGSYFSNWSPQEQDWWLELYEKLGAERYRLLLTGMLRAAFVQTGSLTGKINEIFEVAEKYAETGIGASGLDKNFSSVRYWKLQRNRMWGGLLSILKPECTPEDGGEVLLRLNYAFDWNHPQIIVAAKQWSQSLETPGGLQPGIFGAWCTPDILAIAGQMHDLRTFVEFPKLGKLLEAAGCQDTLVLNHCQNPEIRHLRGDWLILALLSAVPAKPAAKSSGKAAKADAKPKKPKLPTMSAQQKKKFKELTTVEHGGLPTSTAWGAAWQSDKPRDFQKYQREFPHLPNEALMALGGMYPASRTVMTDVAVVRRLNLHSAQELQISLALDARARLFETKVKYYSSDRMRGLQSAFASGDEAAVQWAAKEFIPSPVIAADLYEWSNNALHAIAARNEELISTSISRWPHLADSDTIPLCDSGLLPILQRDRNGVTASLNAILDQERQTAEPENFGVFSMLAHAYFRAAMWLDPELVADFDVTQAAPWDAEFHSVSLSNPHPLEGFDFSTTPAQLRDILVTQTIPDWLRELPAADPTAKNEASLLLTKIGPTPDRVREVLDRIMSGLTAEEFAHRTKLLPLTIQNSKYRPSCIAYGEWLQNAGATVELVP